MHRLLILILTLALSTTLLARATDHNPILVERTKHATALLFAQAESGGMSMRCTATAFAKTGTGYDFVTAAHCVGDDDVPAAKSATGSDESFFMTFDEEGGAKQFWPATVVWVGYQHRGDDFAVFHVESKETWATIPIGDEKKESEGASFINVARPLGLGKQVMYGTISKMTLDRPVINDDINWKGAMVLQLSGVNSGSRGRALVSDAQSAIVGFLVGGIGNAGTIIAIPVSRFTAVQKAIADKTYKWYQPE